jgi:hypothetical protein
LYIASRYSCALSVSILVFPPKGSSSIKAA